jgi:hypothetical protein
MGIDWDSLWGQAETAVNQGFKDLQTVGVPALQSAAERWGIQVLTEQNKETTAQLAAVTKEVMDRPSEEGSFGSYLAGVFKEPVVKQYGPHILIGAVGLLVVGVMIARKG